MTQTYATLWQALCYLSYDSLEAKDPEGDVSLRETIRIARDTTPQKPALLEGAQDGSIAFEGRLGARCDPPPSPNDHWRDFHWTGYGSEFTAISADDWPKVEHRGEGQIDWRGIDWEGSKLKTPRGEFIDVRCLANDLKEWHTGPRGIQVVKPNARTPYQLDTAARSKGGRKSKHHRGLQEFIDDVRDQLADQGLALTLGTLEVWLQNNAPPEKPYESGIDDCDLVYFEDNKTSWTDKTGKSCHLELRSLELYIKRSKTPRPALPSS